MKSYNRLPGWLKVIAPVTFVSVCLGINAIAFTEIRQSVIERRLANTATPEPRSPAVSVQNTVASSPVDTAKQLATIPADRPAQASERATARTALPTTDANASDANATLSDDSTLNSIVDNTTSDLADSDLADSDLVDSGLADDDSAEDPVDGGPADGSAKSVSDLSAEPKYGHLPYSEGAAADMTLVASYAEGDFQRAETLHPDAAKALSQMIAAARSEGIWLVPASGFRTIAQQRTLFNAQITHQGTPAAAAKISAPPGYSEHHTGYAIDLADGSLPQSQDISDSFAETEAYAWLLANALTHGFELSFPEGNDQGISFEPWHWRYIGSPQAKVALKLAPAMLDTRNATSDVIE